MEWFRIEDGLTWSFLKFVNNIKKQAGIEDRDDIVTLFDLIGLDEGD